MIKNKDLLKVVNIEPSKSSLAIKLPVTPISGTSANLEPFVASLSTTAPALNICDINTPL